MLIAEDVLMVGTDPGGKDLFLQHRQTIVGGAVLTDLMLRGNLALDDQGRIQVRDVPPPAEQLLAEGLQTFAARDGRRARFVLAQLGTGLLDTALTGLARGEVLQPEAVKVLGLQVGTTWSAVAPALREHRLRQLAGVLLGVEPATTSTVATIALVHAANILPEVLPQELRPATSDKALRERAREVVTAGWEPRREADLVLAAARATRRAWQGVGRNAGRL